MTPLDPATVLVPVGDKTPVTVDDALFLYDEADRRFFRLNAGARAVYERCDGRRSVSAIADELARQFPDDEDAVRRDVMGTVDGLVELGLVAPV